MVELGKKVMAGDVRSASRLIRNIEDNLPGAKQEIRKIFPYTGKAHVVGLTGPPGAGKSTLTDELIRCFRRKGKTVGVLAVDPSSPFTGGAILGDRIRMQRHAEDPGVFVRSLATRGTMGGLSKAAGDAIHVMDAMGKDIVMVETVGIGQQEVEIIHHAHTVLVVLVPGMGDEIQAIKAGVMEIGDIFVINKAHREGAGKLFKEITAMLDMGPREPGAWRPPIVMVESVAEPHEFERCVDELSDKIEAHYQYLVNTNQLGDRQRRRSLAEINAAVRDAILETVLRRLVADGELDRMVEKALNKESDPYTLAEQVAERYLGGSKASMPVAE
ncbi:MAG: methylmalonyl Co-A mutase-associated GTPase MeaB [Syntrophomonadaceae bacterium]|jgi:LAO/AO transport system kinase|nr:methylmalonyl Co-A mutase-associated GTPase MeaB [Syntrophomonadaceae bacterium]MDH7498048.1 methylmalonyl Co-A mutase-associated GTPase MeaB [Syntrophomonadaceae bacterium]